MCVFVVGDKTIGSIYTIHPMQIFLVQISGYLGVFKSSLFLFKDGNALISGGVFWSTGKVSLFSLQPSSFFLVRVFMSLTGDRGTRRCFDVSGFESWSRSRFHLLRWRWSRRPQRIHGDAVEPRGAIRLRRGLGGKKKKASLIIILITSSCTYIELTSNWTALHAGGKIGVEV